MEKWYHGSRFDFDEFKTKKGTLFTLDYTNPIFLTTDFEFAKAYAGYKDPVVYTVEILTDKIFDPKILPTDYDLYRYELGKDGKKPEKDYELGFKLRNDLDNDPEFEDVDTSNIYNGIMSGDYSSIEDVWFFEWLKKNDFDGCYVWETKTKNVFIFDPKKLRIINKETTKLEKMITKFSIFENKNNKDIVKFLVGKKFINPKSKMFIYHGTRVKPENFVLRDDYDWEDSNSWNGDLPEGYLFLTTSIEEASAYGQYIIPCELKRYDHKWFDVGTDNPSQIFDMDYGIDLFEPEKHFGFWEKFEESGKSALIIKGKNNKWTIITDIHNVIPRIDLAKEFYGH